VFSLQLFPSPRLLRINSLRIVLVFGLALFTARQLSAQTPEGMVRTLAQRVPESRELPEKIAVEWNNVSSLPEAQSLLFREVFLQELGTRRTVLPANAGTPLLRVSLRETPTDFLLVAQIDEASDGQVRMTSLSKTLFLPTMARGAGFRLAKQLLWQQPQAILDAREFSEAASSPPNISLLKTDALAIYREADERLTTVQELGFGNYRYISRGLRGELQKNKDGGLIATLPNLTCLLHGPSVPSDRWTMTCSPNGGAGQLTNSSTSDGDAKPDAAAEITSSCDATAWKLLAGESDWTRPDHLLLVGAGTKRDEAVASLDFGGPVLRVASAQDSKSALAVIFNLSSGNYEVYRVTIACGQ
jgi:hypothetical protein